MFDNERDRNRGSILHFKLNNGLLNIGSLVEVNEVVLSVSSN